MIRKMTIVNINDLKRFDFTPECKTCKYRTELGLFEYCCSFVIDEIRKQRFDLMKKEVFNYANFGEHLEHLDPGNILFQKGDEWTVQLTFQTNLMEDKKVVLRELKKAIEKSMFFNHVNFDKDTLLKKEFNAEPFLVQTKIVKLPRLV